MEAYSHYLLIISGCYKMTIIDTNLKHKIVDNYLNISEYSKIDSIVFLDLDRIVICLSTDVKKTYCIYNRSLNLLTQLDYNHEVQIIVANGFEENKRVKSIYNHILKDYIFQTYFIKLIPEENDQKKDENRKLNSDLICFQEKVLFNRDLNQKNEFIMFLRKFILQVIKNGFYFQLYDYLYYVYYANNKQLFSILVSLVNYRMVRMKLS
jgi:hypothetical protein